MILHNGVEYIRVSRILSQFTDFSAIRPDILANKCRIGTDVHDAIAANYLNKFYVLGDGASGYYDSYEMWYNLSGAKMVESETRYFCNTHLITGKIDALITFAGSRLPILVDFKTCAQTSPEVWSMQAHMYAYLLRTSGRDISDRYLFIKLDPSGALPRICEYRYQQQIFLKCLQAIKQYRKSSSIRLT